MKFAYLRKSILFLESEIDLLKLTFLQANQSLKNTQSNNSKVYFIPQSQGLGIDSMGEFAVSFELSRQFLDETGKPAPFIHIAQALEAAFNFSFGNAYKSKARILSRKPYNLTKALDSLKNLIVKTRRKQDEKR
ncbi:hypothetical protein [Dysgonomonas sp. ZJ279]|uniref:hypothetical protein n=1 Tax=Dysgonomonas sp. ZJ279 TaxID=2709796 RepID=UPI0013EBEAEA|nr:hypothetical protein [Dysgonomonas sp. ZJ279]